MLTGSLKKIAVLVIMLSAPSFGHAQPLPLSFSSAYELAQSSAPELAIARFKVDSADSQRAVALGSILPQVILFGQFSDNRIQYESELSVADQTFYGQRYGLQLSQSLLDLSQGLEVSRLGFVKKQSQEEVAIAETDLLNMLIEAYLTVLLADEDVDQYEAELTSVERQLEEATALYERNLLPVTQVLEIQTRADTVRADVIMSRGKALVAREELSMLVGEPVDELAQVMDEFALLNRFASATDASREASLNSPSIAAAEAALNAAKKAVDAEKANRFPVVNFTYSFQHSDVGFDNLQAPARDTSTLAVGFNYPLFEGGAGIARLKGARAKFNSAETAYRSESIKAEIRARSAWLSLRAATERLLAGRKAIVSARTNLDASRKAVLAGTARASDILIALSQNTRAVRDFSQAKFEYATAWVELEMATGSNPSVTASKISRALHGN